MDCSQSLARRRQRPISREGPFDDPASREDYKAFGGIGSLDDLDRPVALAFKSAAQFVPGIAAIGKDIAQPGEAIPDRLEQVWRTIAVLNIGGMDDDMKRTSRAYR